MKKPVKTDISQDSLLNIEKVCNEAIGAIAVDKVRGNNPPTPLSSTTLPYEMIKVQLKTSASSICDMIDHQPKDVCMNIRRVLKRP